MKKKEERGKILRELCDWIFYLYVFNVEIIASNVRESKYGCNVRDQGALLENKKRI